MQITKENLTIIIVTIKSQNVIDNCLRANLPISVCGEISSDVEQIKFLLNLGLREISTNVSDILIIKEHISKIKIG